MSDLALQRRRDQVTLIARVVDYVGLPNLRIASSALSTVARALARDGGF
jgi:hypothetical protein